MCRPSQFLTAFLLPLFLLMLCSACNTTQETLGQAYVAPAGLHLHNELSPKSTITATLNHGDHVQIIDVQRRMVRVRSDKGMEGWVDSLQLLSPQQMDALTQRRLKESVMPPEGNATAYEALNVHIDPDRNSPAFTQIPEGGAVQILGYKITPKSNAVPRASGLVVSRPKPPSRKSRKDQQARNLPLRPPKPSPPKPPANWQLLSAERIDSENEAPDTVAKPAPVAPAPKPAPTQKPPVLENWTLIRTKSNQTGWVLSRNLMMSIPDEVAQYAEGKRITAFFDLGVVNDDQKGPKHNWLWTTAAKSLPCDFDSWRVFLWSVRKHRYETSYRQRDLEGYFPVHVEPPDPGSPLRTFELITKDDEGKLSRRSYTFDGHLVHLANTELYSVSAATGQTDETALNPKDLASKVAKPGWIKRQWMAVKRRIFGS